MNKKATTIFFGIITFAIIIIVFYVIFSIFLIYNLNNNLNNYFDIINLNKCCNGQQCTDTYYSEVDNMCHLTMCENNVLQFDKSKCVYEPNK